MFCGAGGAIGTIHGISKLQDGGIECWFDNNAGGREDSIVSYLGFRAHQLNKAIWRQ